MRNIFLLVVIVCLTSACSIYHIDSRDTTTQYYPPKKSGLEIVYIERVDQPHEIIGYVTVNTERRWQISNILDKMKREAAILGADAITNIQSDATGNWKSLPAQELIGNAYVRSNFTAAAIIFK